MIIRPKAFFAAALLVASLPGVAQRRYEERGGRDRNSNFYQGVREGGRGGEYYDSRHASDGYDQRYNERRGGEYYDSRRYNERRGGIGPGKGAAIGGAGGAILGAILGGGLKGSLIGGAAGAGIGAIVGESAQNRRDERR